MRPIYSFSPDVIRNIGNECEPPPASPLDRVPAAFNLVASALSGNLIRQNISPSATRSHLVFKHILSRTGDIASPELAKETHAILVSSSGVPNRYRVHDLSVGAGRSASGFLTARIDVSRHVIESCKEINSHHHRHRRVLAMMYAFAVIHPFEDGNGRLIRTLGPIIGSRRDKSDLIFWLYFSLYAKTNEISFIDAIQKLSNGGFNQISEFYLDAISKFSDFSQLLSSIVTKEDDEVTSLTRIIARETTRPRIFSYSRNE